jgi:hypothetical protein
MPGEDQLLLLLVDWLDDDTVAVPVCCELLKVDEVVIPGTESA